MPPVRSAEQAPDSIERAKRVKASKACQYCRDHKLRCQYADRDRPTTCQHCIKFGLDCIYDPTRKKRGTSSPVKPRSPSATLQKDEMASEAKFSTTGHFGPGVLTSSGPEPRILGSTSLSSILQALSDDPLVASHDQAFGHFRVSQGYLYTANPYAPSMERTMIDSRISLDLLESLSKDYADNIAPLNGVLCPKQATNHQSLSMPVLLALCAVAALSRKVPDSVFRAFRCQLTAVFKERALGISTLHHVQAILISCMSAELSPGTTTESGSSAFLRSAVAVRMAQDLGFHRAAASHYPLTLVAQRTRAWVACIITDRLYSTTYGQPPLIDLDYCDDPLEPFRQPELSTRIHRFQLQLYKFSMLLGDVFHAIHRPCGLDVVTDDVLHRLLAKVDVAIAEIPEEFCFYGVMTEPQGGLLNMIVCCVEIIFLRGFTVQHKAAPKHITFRPLPSRWYAVITRSRAVIDWADTSGDLVLDVWLVAMWSLTHAALVQYQTYTSLRDPEALRSLRTAHLCLERWAKGHRDDSNLAVRAKVTDIVRLLYTTACKKTQEAGGAAKFSNPQSSEAAPMATPPSQDELEALGLLDFAAWPLPEFTLPTDPPAEPQFDPLLGIDLLSAMNR